MTTSKIIITENNGYLAGKISNWYKQKDESAEIEILNLNTFDWIASDFIGAEAIIHCASLNHKNEEYYSLDDYLRINTQITVSLARKAKIQGVRSFIFISTMSVYGVEPTCFVSAEISNHTVPTPKSRYAISMMEAEERLLALCDDTFKVAVVRPPTIYGKGCVSEYNDFRKLIINSTVLPQIQSTKSLIYIDNLCECIYLLQKRADLGVFCPQNSALTTVQELANLIAKHNGKKLTYLPFSLPTKLASIAITELRIAFGNSFYALSLSQFSFDYNIVPFEESIRLTEE